MKQNHWAAEEAQYNLAAKALTAAVKKCDKNGVSPEVTVQTLISVAVTLLLSCTEAEDAALHATMTHSTVLDQHVHAV
jgi:hypothetical protein